MTTRRLGVARALVDGRWVDGDVEIGSEGQISAFGVTPGGRRHSAVPGFIDLQVNGFAGINFSDCDLDGHRSASLALARAGVTSYLPTIPTAEPSRYAAILDANRLAVEDDAPGSRPLGVHLEGPFLTRAGAHRPEWFQIPSRQLCDEFLDAAPVVMMTIAPEAPGAFDLIGHLARSGVVVSIGHTNADAACAHMGFESGARSVTHLWNAQTAPTARAPGVVGVALSRPGVFAGIIADLIHVDAETLTLSLAALGNRALAVSDASPFAGLDASSKYRFDGPVSRLADGSVRLDDGTLAGSGVGLDDCLRNLVSVGLDLEQALDCVTRTPARLIGQNDLGRLTPGGRADVVVLNDALEVDLTLVGGRGVDVDK